ncbi:MAG: HD domain-containing protein [Bacteroidota bacterium]|nr:HD domain-containing protein [Bacteroidota bacterium]
MSNNSSQLSNGYRERFDQLILNHKSKFKTEEDRKFLLEIFEFAANAHKNSVRYSGEPYISHPLAVAEITTRQIGLGKTSAAAALLHDVPNKTEYTTEDIERYFGKKIADIVKGLTKIKNTEYFADDYQASIFREILLSISEDMRVIFIKLADKLNSIRTVEYLSIRKQEQTVKDILNIYAPLAHRLGLFEMKTEMEDLSLKYTNPGIYSSIEKKLRSTERERLRLINNFLKPIKAVLDKSEIKYKIQSRTKSKYSIWKKIKQKKIPFKEIYDIFAVRIIYTSTSEEENRAAIVIADEIRELYKEKTDRIRNWLTTPKDTGYRAYHLTVLSAENTWIEVQIRSEEMHTAAEHGLAVHWKYKGMKDSKTKLDENVSEVLRHLKKDNLSAEKFMDKLKLNFFTTEIYTFTPKGQAISLPKNATVLDFAFKVHSELAAKAISAKVNGKIKTLDTKLKNGDKVEIIASENGTAKKEWFNFVITHKALSHLKKEFRKERKVAEDRGIELLHSIFEYTDTADFNSATVTLKKKLEYNSLKDFYIDIGEGVISNDKIYRAIEQCSILRRSIFWTIMIVKRDIKEHNFSKAVKKADCCRPTPQDSITGLFEKDILYAHNINCPLVKLKKNEEKQPIDLRWAKYISSSKREELSIYGKNTKGILSKITSVFAIETSINISKLNFMVEKHNFELNAGIMYQDKERIQKLLKKLLAVKGVEQILLGSSKVFT